MDCRLFLLSLLALVVTCVPAGLSSTDCYPAASPDCTINIIINIAFSYNDSEIAQGKIDAWVKEIEETWNGQMGYQTYGDCNCKVKFQVNTMKVTDPAQINCTPGPPDYHCIMITDHQKNRPKNSAGNETYRGYMYNVSENGSSVNGWWSDEMGEPHPNSPTGENALDAAHEAGHLLGLGDDYEKGPPERYGKNIMGTTYGPDAKPTQDQIDAAVENNCGEDACPDGCCCGNGINEDDKGEMCDPLADPTGCGDDTTLYCCRFCCQCHRQACMPEAGAYATQTDCQSECKNGTCYLNYNTGCWDCREHDTVVTPAPAVSEPAKPIGGGISGSILGILGVLGLIGGGALIAAGAKKENKGYLVGGGAMALAGFLILFALVVNAGITEGPIGVTKGADSGPGPQSIGTIVSVSKLLEPDPAPAQDPVEEVLKEKKNITVPESSEAAAGNESAPANQTPAVPQPPAGPVAPAIPSKCGDRKCDANETCSNCASDCGACPPICGNHVCESGETCSSCKKDCGECPPVCGDDSCEDGEDCSSCPDDCGTCGPECGNGLCEAGENCECEDCEDACPPGFYCSPDLPDADPMGCSHFGGANCGNGLCDETEYCYTCPIDCKCGPETCCSPSNSGIGCGADCTWTPS